MTDIPTMSDEDFDAGLNRISCNRKDLSLMIEFQHHQFTPDQVIKLCVAVSQWLSAGILNGRDIPPSGIDILIDSGGRIYHILWFLMANDVPMTTEQVVRLLSDPRENVRREAYTLPQCTDAMKVWYHLTYGDD